MLRQTFVQVGMMDAQQIEHTSIFAEHVFKMGLGFHPKSLAQVVIEVGKQSKVRREGFQISQIEPLACKILNQVQ